jgi:CheY-like chemotaxis protein
MPSLGFKRILLVDDHADTREIYAFLLRDSGHVVYEAADGPAALAILRNTAVDAAVVDIGLPGMDGYELARQIRAAKAPADLTLIAVTGRGLPEDRAHSRVVGFDLHLVKPVAPDELLRALLSARGGT